MAWPKSNAARITSLFFRLKFNENVKALLFENVLVKEMNFYLLDGSSEARDERAKEVSGELLHFLDGMNIDLEKTGNRTEALKELIAVMAIGDNNSSKIPEVVDTHFKFSDEETEK